MNSLWGCHLYPASRTPVVQSQRLDVSCQHVKLIVRLNSVCGCVAVWLCGCANPSRDLAVTHSLSPSLITELSLDSSISDIAYSPHIRANALPSSTVALSTCSNSSDVINAQSIGRTECALRQLSVLPV